MIPRSIVRWASLPVGLALAAGFAWWLQRPAPMLSTTTQGPTVTHPGRKPNRLIHEKSPYLLQHAHNPVAWYPWGPAALERARTEQKPIFLSIGYSTCH